MYVQMYIYIYICLVSISMSVNEWGMIYGMI